MPKPPRDPLPPGAKAGAKAGATREYLERRERFTRARREALQPAADGPVALYGWHTVKAALENPQRRLRKLLATENAARRLGDEQVPLRVDLEIVRPGSIAERLPAGAVHQGIYAEADPLPAMSLEELGQARLVLALDQITDPHNVGAILRSAAAFGVDAVISTARHSPETTGALAKAASGALDHVPSIVVQNLAHTLGDLKASGYLLVGLDSGGESDLSDLALRAPLALVLGAEGRGLRQLTRATCDHVARLHLPGRLQSLNVSNAAALSLYVATRKLSGA